MTNDFNTTREQEAPAYAKPSIKDLGDVNTLTAGSASGNFLDATFPGNTPVNQLTFS